MSDADDPTLLQRWCDGDEDAGSQLVERHFPAVYRFFRRRHPGTAEDLTQQTFIACQQSLERLPQVRSFRAFLLGIARNTLLANARAEGRRERRHAALADEPDPSRVSPSKAVAFREEQSLLLRALRTLPIDQQLPIELHYWDALSTAEIAEVLGVAQGTIKWRLATARDKLREAIESLPAPKATRHSTVTNLESWAASLREMLHG